MKYMILVCTPSQRDPIAMVVKPASGEPGWTGAGFSRPLGQFHGAVSPAKGSRRVRNWLDTPRPPDPRRRRPMADRLADGAPVVPPGGTVTPRPRRFWAGYWIFECDQPGPGPCRQSPAAGSAPQARHVLPARAYVERPAARQSRGTKLDRLTVP